LLVLLSGITAGKKKLSDVVGRKAMSESYDPQDLIATDENAEDILQYMEELKERSSGSIQSGEQEASGDEYMKIIDGDAEDLDFGGVGEEDYEDDELDYEEDEEEEGEEGDEEFGEDDGDEEEDGSEVGSDNAAFDSMHAEDGDGDEIDGNEVEVEEEEPAKRSVKAASSSSSASASTSTAEGVTTKYVPPHLRNKDKPVDANEAKMKRELKGFLNKLSEGNLVQIAELIEKLFKTSSRSCT